MLRGRQLNYDERIAELTAQPRNLIIARERVVMEARVVAQIGALEDSLGGLDAAEHRGPGAKPPILSANSKTTARKPAAGRLRQIAAMKADWKKRKAAAAENGK